MTDPQTPDQFAAKLLQQEPILQTPRYQEHRMELELQMKRAEHNEKRVYWIVIAAAIVMGAAFLLISSNTLGGVDPWDQDATVLSVTVGMMFILSAVTFWYGLLAYYGRFRVVTKDVKEKLIFESIRELRQEVQELRQLVKPTTDKPQA